MEAQALSIEDIFRQELPPDSMPPAEAPFNASDAIAHNIASETKPENTFPRAATAEHLKATQFPTGVSGNPGGRPSTYTLTRALREVGTVGKAKEVAATMYDLAAGGNVRAAEFIRDTTEGKPGVRIADGEWNPETAPTFNIMASYRTLVAQPQDSLIVEGEPQPDTDTAQG